MSDPIDKAFDDYLSGNSRVSKRYRELDDAGVPPHLDQQVLARARAAVADQQSSSTDELERLRQRRKRLMRWTVPVGLAASVVLVVSIVMQSGVQHEALSLPQQPASAPAAAPEQSDESSDKPSQVVGLTQETVPPPPAQQSAAATSRREVEKVETSATRLRKVQQDSPVAVSDNALPTESAPAPVIVAPEPSAPMADAASAGKEETEFHQAAEVRHAGPLTDDELSEIIVTGSQVSRRAPALRGPRSTVPAASAKSQSDAAGVQGQVLEAPEHWLERIRQLRKDSKTQDADREWKHFREVYPDYEVAEADAARMKAGDGR